MIIELFKNLFYFRMDLIYSRTLFVLSFIFWSFFGAYGQIQVAITIDDLPNIESGLLQKLDSLQIPVAIFINEGIIYRGDHAQEKSELLEDWISRDYVLAGNHSYNHPRYSEVGADSFAVEVEKGEILTRALTEKYSKSLHFFRFPFNDLGKDSLQHIQSAKLLEARNYQNAPFTIESSDWMFNAIYKHYLEKGERSEAIKTGQLYVAKTLEYFDFFESMAMDQYGREVKQIYLCHDNQLNKDFLPELINKLKARNYNFISLEEAMEDPIYTQEDKYYQKWGVSWFYRWMDQQDERLKLMRKEPDISESYQLFEKLSN